MSRRPRIGAFVVAFAKAPRVGSRHGDAHRGPARARRGRRAADLPGGPPEPAARGLPGGDADADLPAGDRARGVRLLRRRAARRGLDPRAPGRLARVPAALCEPAERHVPRAARRHAGGLADRDGDAAAAHRGAARRAGGRVVPAVVGARARVRLPVARLRPARGAGRGARGAQRVRAAPARPVAGADRNGRDAGQPGGAGAAHDDARRRAAGDDRQARALARHPPAADVGGDRGGGLPRGGADPGRADRAARARDRLGRGDDLHVRSVAGAVAGGRLAGRAGGPHPDRCRAAGPRRRRGGRSRVARPRRARGRARRDGADERIAERARHHGLRLGAEHRVVVVAYGERPAYQARERVRRLAGAAIAECLPGSLIGEVGDVVAAAVPIGGEADELERVRDAVAAAQVRVGDPALAAGIGPVARTARGFPASYAAARRCVDVLWRLGRAGETLAADELGLLGLLVDSARPEELRGVADEVLGPVLERDARTGSALLATLEAYLDAGCDARACAAALFVHVNTVKYRLRQVEELCGLTLRDPQDLLRVTMARLIVRLVGEGAG